MADLNPIIAAVAAAADQHGLPALAKKSGVPYTTLVDWQKAGWRPRSVKTLERLLSAANDAQPEADAA